MKYSKIFPAGLLAIACLYLTSSSPAADNGLVMYLKIVFAGSTPASESSDGILVMHPAYELEFGTLSNRLYQLQGTTNSADAGSWTNIGKIQMGDGNSLTTFVSTRDASNQFYRVLISDFSTGLVAHYKLDGDADDETIFANNGMLSGTTTTTNRFGAVSSALEFNGSSDGISIPDASVLNFSNAFTLSAWVNFKSGGTFNPRIFAKAGSSPSGYQLFTVGTGASRIFNCTLFFEGMGFIGVDSEHAYPADSWHHVVATYDGTAIRIYVNGSLDGTTAISGTILQTSTPLHLGRQSGFDADFLRGSLDEARMYNRALAPDEVEILYTLPE